MTIQQALDDYLLACQADGLSPATVKWYESRLSAFAAQFPGQDLAEVSAPMIRQYIVGLQDRDSRYINASQKPPQVGGLSAASVAGHVRALHTFWAWCTREYTLEHNPMSNIRRQRPPNPEPKAICPADFIKLFHATGDDDTGQRDRAMLAFLADTGCRLGGLLSLTLENLLLDQKKAVICEKGQKLRSVVYTHYTARIMRQWIDVREASVPYVFVSMRDGQPLTNSGVNQILKRLKARAKIAGRVNPHSFRHNFAREYLRNGGDLVTLARLLGHADISTTAAYYAVFSQDELAELHEKFSPLNTIGALL